MRDRGKYRGQRVDNGEWVYGYYINDEGEYPQIYISTDEIIHIEPETVGEYTGLTDKRKGQGLYDGDRVIIGGDVGVLVWDELELCWSLQIEIESDEYQSICRFYSYEEIDAVEYIGNEEKP